MEKEGMEWADAEPLSTLCSVKSTLRVHDLSPSPTLAVLAHFSPRPLTLTAVVASQSQVDCQQSFQSVLRVVRVGVCACGS